MRLLCLPRTNANGLLNRLKRKPLVRFKAELQNAWHFGAEQILPHDSYLINLGAPEEEKLNKSRAAFIDEMERCNQLGLTLAEFPSW